MCLRTVFVAAECLGQLQRSREKPSLFNGIAERRQLCVRQRRRGAWPAEGLTLNKIHQGEMTVMHWLKTRFITLIATTYGVAMVGAIDALPHDDLDEIWPASVA